MARWWPLTTNTNKKEIWQFHYQGYKKYFYENLRLVLALTLKTFGIFPIWEKFFLHFASIWISQWMYLSQYEFHPARAHPQDQPNGCSHLFALFAVFDDLKTVRIVRCSHQASTDGVRPSVRPSTSVHLGKIIMVRRPNPSLRWTVHASGRLAPSI